MKIVFGLDMSIMTKLDYFYSSSSSITADQLFHYRLFRKIQNNDAIWEILFTFDTLVGIVSKGRFLIDESKYPSLAEMRFSSYDYRPYKCPDYQNPLSTSNLSSNSDSTFTSSSNSSSQMSWKTALGGGLTHTITKSISSDTSSSLNYLFPEPGSRCPRIRLYYLMRKITRWKHDSSHGDKSGQQKLLPKLNALIGDSHTVTRRQLHEALVEWFETLEPQWKSVPRLTDWLELTQPMRLNDPTKRIDKLDYIPTILSTFLWFSFSLIHGNSNDNDLYSTSSANTIIRQFSSSSPGNNNNNNDNKDNNYNKENPMSTPLEDVSSKLRFIGTSSTWCALAFRSLVRLITEICIHGEHPGIWGLTLPYFLHISMNSLLMEVPIPRIPSNSMDINPRTNTTMPTGDGFKSNIKDGGESYVYLESEQKTMTRLVDGITVEEVLYGVQYQFLPFVTEVANVWPMGSAWITAMNGFIEKLKKLK